jgi:hypothetical protein
MINFHKLIVNLKFLNTLTKNSIIPQHLWQNIQDYLFDNSKICVPNALIKCRNSFRTDKKLNNNVLDFCNFLILQKYSGDHKFDEVYDILILANPNTILEYNNGERLIWKTNPNNFQGPTTFLQAESSSMLMFYKRHLTKVDDIIHKLNDLDIMTLKMILNAVINDSFEGVSLRSTTISFKKGGINRTQREMVLQIVNYCLSKIDVPKYKMFEDKKFKFTKKKEEIYTKFLAAIEKFEIINKQEENLKITVFNTFKDEESRKLRKEELELINKEKDIVKKEIRYRINFKSVLNQIIRTVTEKKNNEIKKINETPIYIGYTPSRPSYFEYSSKLTEEQNEIMLEKKEILFDKCEFNLFKEIRGFINKRAYHHDKVLQNHENELVDHAYDVKRLKKTPMDTVTIHPEPIPLNEYQEMTNKPFESKHVYLIDNYKKITRKKFQATKFKNRWYDNMIPIDKDVSVKFNGQYHFFNKTEGEKRLRSSRPLHRLLSKRKPNKKTRKPIDFKKLDEDLDQLINTFQNQDRLIRNLGSISIANRIGITARRCHINLNSVNLSLGNYLTDDYFALLPKKMKRFNRKGDGNKFKIQEITESSFSPPYKDTRYSVSKEGRNL